MRHIGEQRESERMTEIDLVHGQKQNDDSQLRPNGGHNKNDPDTFHFEYASNPKSVPEAIVKATAFVHNVEPDELSPLANFIDPDALDCLLTPRPHNHSTRIEITFEYEGLQITVDNSNNIWLQWL